MADGVLGKVYADNEVICRQGEKGDCMFIVQTGAVEVLHQSGASERVVGELVSGDIFGEMSIFDRQPRSATVRARSEARVLTLDKRSFLRRAHEDPTLAFRILEKLSLRIRRLDDEVVQLRAQLAEASAPVGARS